MTRIKIIARDSLLSQKQLEEVTVLLKNIPYDIELLKTFGDKNQNISLKTDVSEDFFTRELDTKLLNKEADIAVHSAKDLPEVLDSSLCVVAILPCYDSTDALVSRDNIPLAELPSKSSIATSSSLREKEIRLLRDDLLFKDIRGNIEERIEQIDLGYADAVIVATCALKRLSLNHRIADILPIETYPLQGHLAVVAHRHRTDLKKFWMKYDIRQSWGRVYLSGFGPGDPELMTIKTYRLLDQCDVILYDDLINPSVLEGKKAKIIYVGKRKGYHYRNQQEINQLLKKHIWNGSDVLRLKGGDPSIFARTGEETRYLNQWKIAYEIIPGVTSACSASASQGISLTERHFSKTLAFLTGHHAQEEVPAVPLVDTLVYYMAATEFPTLTETLIQKGRSPQEPVLIVENSSFPYEKSEQKTIETLSQTKLQSPLMVIIGKIVLKSCPPSRLLYTGLDVTRFRSSFYKVIHYPLIKTHFLEDAGQKFIEKEQNCDAFIFTSRQAVKSVFENNLLRDTKQKAVIAIGEGTQELLKKYSIAVDHIPSESNSESLNKMIKTFSYSNYLYPCSDLSKNSLHGYPSIHPLPIYRTEMIDQVFLDLSFFDYIVFTSPSTVLAFLKIYSDIPSHLLCEVWGPLTKNTLLRSADVSEEQIIENNFSLKDNH